MCQNEANTVGTTITNICKWKIVKYELICFFFVLMKKQKHFSRHLCHSSIIEQDKMTVAYEKKKMKKKWEYEGVNY
jgi:hypothetical protein